MPPFIPTRLDSSRPQGSAEKESLFDVADKPKKRPKTLQDNKNFIKELEDLDDGSSLSDVSSHEFEDVLSSGRKPKSHNVDEEEDDDEIGWEDAIQHPVAPSHNVPRDLNLTLEQDDDVPGSLTGPQDRKKGPSKIEREIRISTHRMHVQFLLFHNLSRSRWACDTEVQKILLDQLPDQMRLEIQKWRKDSGFHADRGAFAVEEPASKKRKGKNRPHKERNQRDWGGSAERQEKSEPEYERWRPHYSLT